MKKETELEGIAKHTGNGSSATFDATIIGGGVAGLMLSYKLSGLGIKVALIEKNNSFANGPSTRNEGWLHNGTYHANSINNRDDAIQVARRCMYGHKFIREFAPEAVEDPELPSIALLKNQDRYEEIIDRWKLAGVPFEELSLQQAKTLVPELKINYASKAFRVQDVGINTRILYSKLLHLSNIQGTQIFTGSELKFENECEAVITTGKDKIPVKSKLYLYTSGYSNQKVIEDNFGIKIPIRYWKSHLINTKRISNLGSFYLDPQEIGMMHHEGVSVVGFNEDAILLDKPDFEVVSEKIDALLNKLKQSYIWENELKYSPIACVKVDVPKELNVNRSLNISITEPLKSHICVFPGKMTETPYLVDYLVKFVSERLSNDKGKVAFRPADIMKNQLCKQGVDFEEKTVSKIQSSFDTGRLEQKISELYTQNHISPIRTPKVYGTTYKENKIKTIFERIPAQNLLGNNDLKLTEKLVEDLALFHEMFSQNPEINSSSVLYRDAIKSNYLYDKRELVHIDFSSSNLFVHGLDDLALLLNPAWGEIPGNEIPNLISLYFDKRDDFRKQGVYSLDKLSQTEYDMIKGKTPKERLESYSKKISEMAVLEFFDKDLLKDMSDVNFTLLKRLDYEIFNRYRDLRAKYYVKKIWQGKDLSSIMEVT